MIQIRHELISALHEVAVTTHDSANTPPPAERCESVLCLVEGPYLEVRGVRTHVLEGCQPLLVFLALHGGSAPRWQVAGQLWPEVQEERAAGNLRSVLWRLRNSGARIVDADKRAVWIRAGVGTDVDMVEDWASRITGGTARSEDLNIGWWHPEVIDLLPGWQDDWIVFKRERLRQLVLHALESLVSIQIAASRYAEGIQAAMLAVEIEPLRESAQRRLIEAHMAEGNVCEAHRVLQVYRELLHLEMGFQPSAELMALVPGGVHGGS
ncbi:BTAD domain-containing putative transcriptional regulator [Kocuria sp. NPDC057446]|uniref:AfsR/SARP family transcriptional regulator n=1 Tax=Kocuria sp. NPDC057446 TaxID=3346137 RepID=UPI0036870C42